MKKIINSAIASLMVFALIFTSCDGVEDVNYTPKDYNTTAPAVQISFSNFDEAKGEIDVTFTSDGNGTVFYAVAPTNVAKPTSTSLINGNTAGTIENKNLSLNANVPATIKFSNIGTYRDIEVFALMTSTDGFGTNIVSKNIAIDDTMAPVLEATSPEHQSGGIDFKDQSITFTFNEAVKLADNATFAFQIFENGVGVVQRFSLTNPTVKLGGTVVGDYATEITISGWDGQPNNFTIVNFDAGTFVDQKGLGADGISGFSYYFRSRQRTTDEIADLLVADWNYQITNNAFNPAVIPNTTGTWSVTKGSKPGTIMLINQVDTDINNFIGADNSATMNFEVTVGEIGTLGASRGYLTIKPFKSGVTVDLWGDGTEAYWTGYFESVFTPYVEGLAGYYDISDRQMLFRVDYGSQAGSANNNYYFGDIVYLYNYVPGTGPLGRTSNTLTKDNRTLTVKGEVAPTNVYFTKEQFINAPNKEKGTFTNHVLR